jgi:solute carrier family 25 oxoglutarate transporter 11
MALNMGMLASNDQAKEMLEAAGFEKGGQVAVIGSATIAGFFASVCSLPFDFIKTRLQKMTPNPDGSMPYKGPVDCAAQVLWGARPGWSAWAGWDDETGKQTAWFLGR